VPAAVDHRRADHRAGGRRRRQPGPGARLRNHPGPGCPERWRAEPGELIHRITCSAHGAKPDSARHPIRAARCNATRPPREWPTTTTGAPGSRSAISPSAQPASASHPAPLPFQPRTENREPVHRDVRHLTCHRPGDRDQPEHRRAERRDPHLRIGGAPCRNQHRRGRMCRSGGCAQSSALRAGRVVSRGHTPSIRKRRAGGWVRGSAESAVSNGRRGRNVPAFRAAPLLIDLEHVLAQCG